MSNPSKPLTQRPGAREIYDTLKGQIASGVFRSGGQLPSSRTLATELGVSRTTVTVAYEQLLAEGFIEVQQGSRPRVALSRISDGPRHRAPRPSRQLQLAAFGERIRKLPAWPYYSAPRLVADFRYGSLSSEDFPASIWKRAMNSAMQQQPKLLAYNDPRGSHRLRLALQAYLWRARTLKCDVDQILVVSGSQQGLDLCARLILDAGDRFVIEDPCYAMARRIFSCTGATPVPIPVDADGLQTERLADVDARLAYVTPSHQFPLGGVMSISRRHQLLAWARKRNAFVIEDDYDSEYRYDIRPVPPLHGLDSRANVIYLGTISKTLSPTLRIGYLVVPPELQEVFAAAKQLTDRHSPVLEQEALASLIEEGAYDRHVRRARRLNGDRRKTLLNALQHAFARRITIDGADAGLHVVIWFDELPRSLESTLIEATRSAGVGVHSVTPHYESNRTVRDKVGLVMGYSALSPGQIERGVRILADAVHEVRRKR